LLEDFTTINAVKEMLRLCTAPRAASAAVVDRAAESSAAVLACRQMIDDLRARGKEEALEKRQAGLAARREARNASLAEG
jgi:hypothetical protein